MDTLPQYKQIDGEHFRLKIDDYFYKTIMSTGVLNYSEDKALLVYLYELCSLIDMFNNLVQDGNDALILSIKVNRSLF